MMINLRSLRDGEQTDTLDLRETSDFSQSPEQAQENGSVEQLPATAIETPDKIR
jgi:hypothetical protein